MPPITADALDELRDRLDGGVCEPGSPEYDDTRTLFNAMIERRPALVTRCATPDDVIAALAFARDNGLDVTVRAGGHSVVGQSLLDDGLVIDLRPMNAIEVDADSRVARVGGGALWSEVDRATQEHGLATTGGTRLDDRRRRADARRRLRMAGAKARADGRQPALRRARDRRRAHRPRLR